MQITNVVSLGRDKRSAGRAESNSQVISLLDILEKENQELRKAVIDLSLETLRLREAIGHRERQRYPKFRQCLASATRLGRVVPTRILEQK